MDVLWIPLTASINNLSPLLGRWSYNCNLHAVAQFASWSASIKVSSKLTDFVRHRWFNISAELTVLPKAGTIIMATNYTVRFKNSTQNAYHFAVYQKYPASPGLDSVAWQVRGLGPGATNRVDWTLDYQVAIANWDVNGGLYSGVQMAPATLGQFYEVITEESDIPVINTAATQTDGPGLIKLQNNTNPPKSVSMGFAISNTLVAAEKQVGAGECVEFSVHPQYYVACFRAIKQGQLVSEGIELGPVTLEFQNEYTDYTVEATTVAGRVTLKNPVPST